LRGRYFKRGLGAARAAGLPPEKTAFFSAIFAFFVRLGGLHFVVSPRARENAK